MSEELRMRQQIKADKREKFALALTAACGVALSGGVLAALVYLLLAFMPLAAARPAFGQSAPVGAGVRLQAGIEKEDVDGDMKSAMDIYQKIAADTAAPREVRARALLRLAGCEEKLGREAKHVYEQIVRDYSDQPVAGQARKRLALIARQEHPALPPTMSVRKIDYSSLGSFGVTDTDGERAVYLAANTLYFGDLVGHRRRMIGNFLHLGWVPSRDFSMVVLNLLGDPTRPHTLAVVKTDGTGYRELIRDDAQNSIFGANNNLAMSWSWDDRNLLLSDFHPDAKRSGQLWLVSAADGRRRVLADAGDGAVRKAVFSPDGRFAAYSVAPRDLLSKQTSRVFVVPVVGGEPRMVYESAPWKIGNPFLALMDWSSDGRYLLIHDIRQGKSGLYLLPIRDGVANGEVSFVRFGNFDEGYSTASGAMVYVDKEARPASLDVSLASIDADGRPRNWRSVYLNLNGNNRPWPSFSPDGSQIAYICSDANPDGRDLIVRDLSTGQEREVYQSSNGTLNCRFSSQTPNLFCDIENGNGQTDFISVSAKSGKVEQIARFPGSMFLLQPSLDDQTFYFTQSAWRIGEFAPPILRWDRASQQETTIEPALKEIPFAWLSLDGKWLARLLSGTISIRPVSGGDWMSLASGDFLPHPPYVLPNGDWVWYQGRDSAGKPGLYRVSAGGGTPERLGDLPDNNSGGNFFFSPDGRQVLAVGSDYGNFELLVLENFVPSARK